MYAKWKRKYHYLMFQINHNDTKKNENENMNPKYQLKEQHQLCELYTRFVCSNFIFTQFLHWNAVAHVYVQQSNVESKNTNHVYRHILTMKVWSDRQYCVWICNT